MDRQRISDRKQRWLAVALLEIERRPRRIRRYRALRLPQQVLLGEMPEEDSARDVQAA